MRDGRDASDVDGAVAASEGAHEEVDASHLARQSVERRSRAAEDEADGRREMVNVQRMVYEWATRAIDASGVVRRLRGAD